MYSQKKSKRIVNKLKAKIFFTNYSSKQSYQNVKIINDPNTMSVKVGFINDSTRARANINAPNRKKCFISSGVSSAPSFLG